MRLLELSLFLIAATAPLSVSGCAAQPPPVEEEEDLPVHEQTIPLAPVSKHSFNPNAVGQVSSDGGELRFEASVDYALGDGYPTLITQEVGAGRWTGCEGKLEGNFEALTISGESDAVRAELDQAGDVVITLLNEGSASVIVKGEYEVSADGPECGFPAGARVPTTDVMLVRARRPARLAVRFSDCGDAEVLRVATDVRVTPEFSLVDAKGELFLPRNANARHPAALTIRSAQPFDEAVLSAPYGPESQGVLSLNTPDAEGLLELQAPFGPTTVVEVVGPSRVQAEVQFGVELKTWFPIQTGDAVDMAWATAVQVLTMNETVEGTKLCSALNDDWFTLESATPGVCSVEAQQEDAPSSDHRLADAAVVNASGTCRLKVRATDLAGGAGLSSELDAAITKP